MAEILIRRLDTDLPLPARAHPGDAGLDLCAAEDVVLAPGERASVRTGIAVAIPVGYAGLVVPRSGLAARHGLATVIVRHVITDDAPFARLAALVVTETSRGRGVGSALVAGAERIARRAGCALLEVTSGDHRPQAHAFYRGLGFEERPRRFVKRLTASRRGRRSAG